MHGPGAAWLAPAARAPVLASAGAAWALERTQPAPHAAARALLPPAISVLIRLARSAWTLPGLGGPLERLAARAKTLIPDAHPDKEAGSGAGGLLRGAAFKRGLRILAALLAAVSLWRAPHAEAQALRCVPVRVWVQ